MNRRDLRGEVVWHTGTVGFVVGEQRVTEGLAFCVKYDRAIIKSGVFFELFKHIHHAIHRAGGLSSWRA